VSRTNWTFPRRKERQEESVERQEYYDSLTVAQKITVVESRRGNSKKELKRLKV